MILDPSPLLLKCQKQVYRKKHISSMIKYINAKLLLGRGSK